MTSTAIRQPANNNLYRATMMLMTIWRSTSKSSLECKPYDRGMVGTYTTDSLEHFWRNNTIKKSGRSSSPRKQNGSLAFGADLIPDTAMYATRRVLWNRQVKDVQASFVAASAPMVQGATFIFVKEPY